MKTILLLAAVVATWTAGAQTTSFESNEGFTSGQSIIGQNGWTTTMAESALSQELAVITNERASVGNQSLKLDANGQYDDTGETLGVLVLSPFFDNQSTQRFSLNFYIQDDEWDGSSDAFVYLLGDSGNQLDDAVVLHFSYTGAVRYVNFELSTPGYVAFNDATFLHDTWNNITIERQANAITYILNGEVIGTSFLNPQVSTIRTIGIAHDNYSTPIFVDNLIVSGDLHTPNFTTATFKLYPNPGNDHLNVVASNGLLIQKVLIYDVNGRLIHTADGHTILNGLDLSDLSSGIYTIEVHTPAGSAFQKWIKS